MKRQLISVLSTNLITPLGLGTVETFEAIEAGISGLRKIQNLQNPELNGCFSLFTQKQWDLLDADLPDEGEFTQLETLLLVAAKGAIVDANINHKSEKTLFIVASAHGNGVCDTTNSDSEQRFSLNYSAACLCRYFDNPTPPVVISDGTLSGLQAIIRGQHELISGRYDHVVIVVSDIYSRSTIGQISDDDGEVSARCHSHSMDKDGEMGGEAAVAMVLSRYNGKGISLSVGCSTETDNFEESAGLLINDRDTAIAKALAAAQVTVSQVDVVVHSGVSTISYDSQALSAFANAGISGKPTLCLNGYFGHTMGVSGILDIGIGIQMLTHNTLVECLGSRESDSSFHEAGQAFKESEKLSVCLKAAVDSAGDGLAFVLSKN